MIDTIRKYSTATRATPPVLPGFAPASAHHRTASRMGPRRQGTTGSDAPLAGLSSSTLSDRFRSWRGRSGRRYVFSVFRLESGLERLPVDAEAVVIAVLHEVDGTRRKLWVAETGDDPHHFFRSDRLRSLAARPDVELHLHLLAVTASDRRAIVDDLDEV